MNTENGSSVKDTALKIYLKFTAVFTLIFASIAYVFVPMMPMIMQDVLEVKSFLGIDFTGEKEQSYVNVLLLGLDKDETRSDVIMVAQLNLVNNSVTILQIPRDTYVNNRRPDKKINSAYGVGGPEMTINEVQSIVDVEIDGYVTVTISGFRDVIDAVGGIYYDVPQNMNYDDPYQDLHIHLEKGYQLLDGAKAEQYVRYRSGYASGDIGRVEAQSDFIKEAIAQIIERNSTNEEADTSKLITALASMVETDFTLSDMLKYAPYILNVNMDHVNVMMIAGEAQYKGDVSYFIPDAEGNRKLVREYLTPDISEADLSEIVARDKAIGSGSSVFNVSDAADLSVLPENISVYIMDYSDTDGSMLEEISSLLEEEGFKVAGSVCSQTAYSEKTHCICRAEILSTSAASVASALNLETYLVNPALESDADVVVIIGKDM